MHTRTFFPLAPENQVGEKKAPSITLSLLRFLFKALLPTIKNDLQVLIDQAIWIQNRNHASYHSHRKRKIMETGIS